MKNLKRLAAALLALLLLGTVCAVAAEEPAPQEPPAAAGSELPDKDEPESAMPGVPPVGKPVEIIAPPGRAAETAARSKIPKKRAPALRYKGRVFRAIDKTARLLCDTGALDSIRYNYIVSCNSEMSSEL